MIARSLTEANFIVAYRLCEIARTCGVHPSIVGVHSVRPVGDGAVSVWLDLDAPVGEGDGVLWVHIDERVVHGLDNETILAALTSSNETKH